MNNHVSFPQLDRDYYSLSKCNRSLIPNINHLSPSLDSAWKSLPVIPAFLKEETRLLQVQVLPEMES